MRSGCRAGASTADQKPGGTAGGRRTIGPVSTLPAGVVTFLFSDIEGSTRLARAFGDARWELLEEHRQTLRQAFAAHSGTEVDTEGDAFFVVFTRATDALAAAIEGQCSMEEHAWPDEGRVRVRLGLHTGEALPSDDRYVGHEVHRARAVNHFLTMVAVVEQLRGRSERAGRLFAAVRYLGGAADLPVPFRTPGTMSLYRHYLPLVRTSLGTEEARSALDGGRAMASDDAHAHAYALAGLD